MRIQNTNLKRTLLFGSNINEVEFLKCKWPEKGNRYFVFDEDFFEKKEKFKDSKSRKKYNPNITLQGLEQEYLRLQTNFEKNKRYAEAGDFYIGAMEMRRRQLAQK